MFLLLQGGLFWVSSSIRLPETEVFKQTTSLLLLFFFFWLHQILAVTQEVFLLWCAGFSLVVTRGLNSCSMQDNNFLDKSSITAIFLPIFVAI